MCCLVEASLNYVDHLLCRNTGIVVARCVDSELTLHCNLNQYRQHFAILSTVCKTGTFFDTTKCFLSTRTPSPSAWFLLHSDALGTMHKARNVRNSFAVKYPFALLAYSSTSDTYTPYHVVAPQWKITANRCDVTHFGFQNLNFIIRRKHSYFFFPCDELNFMLSANLSKNPVTCSYC
jgi:hypothetical protein